MNGHILIVENENDIADVMRRYLEFEGFTIVCAGTCREARAAIAAERPELIVLDWHLPDADSDAWAEELRAVAVTADIPIIMMTGGYPTPSLLSQLSAASIPLLIKPFSLDQLVQQIKSMVARERVFGYA
jgi:DNA-binding response OmpR family regulator